MGLPTPSRCCKREAASEPRLPQAPKAGLARETEFIAAKRAHLIADVLLIQTTYVHVCLYASITPASFLCSIHYFLFSFCYFSSMSLSVFLFFFTVLCNVPPLSSV